MSDDPYNGRCPLCRGQLILKDGFLSCAEAEHYQIGQQDFESLWDLFDRDGMDGETLWRTLVERNISPNKPSQMDLEELTDEIEEQRRPAAGDRLE